MLILTASIVHCSPLQRAHRTADIICDTLGLPKPVVLSSLIERDFGVVTGEPHSEIVPMCPPDIISTATITYFLHPKGAETSPEFLDRARQLLNELKAGVDGNLLLVTHGDFGNMIYAAYYGHN